MTEPKPRDISEFTYEGKPVYELESVYEIKDRNLQLVEIHNRLVALRKYSLEHGTIMSLKHIRNVLGINSHTFSMWSRAMVKLRDGTIVKACNSDLPEDEKKFREDRAALLRKWFDLTDQWCLDAVMVSKNTVGAIYLSKSIWKNYDTPQEKRDNKLGIEVILRRAKEKEEGR
jgi:hypothetical protein